LTRHQDFWVVILYRPAADERLVQRGAVRAAPHTHAWRA
jgi:hypothetical protein